jgi:enamine deaminase RidA (YjgF/YER057c/UK114 family)
MKKYLKYGSLAVLGAGLFISGAVAADMTVMHNQESAKAPYASSVMVPAGYNTFYISGAAGKGADTATQTAATLDNLKAQLAKLGLTLGDVVQAHVFLAGDPAKGGKMDFAGMNSSWFKEFGTAEQPNKPARAAFQVAELAGPNTLVEIEFIAVKKAN